MRTMYSVLACALLVACGEKSEAPLAPAPTSMSASAQAHLDEVLALYEARSVRRRQVDWVALQADVYRVAGAAQTPRETYPAIRRAIELVGDGHSIYVPSIGDAFGVGTRTCSAAPVPFLAPQLPREIGYVRVRAFSGTPEQATVFAQALADSLRRRDQEDPIGWIVDLRSNTGGSMYPMVAGIGPLFGADTLGWFVDADGNRTPWGYRGGASYHITNELHRVSAPFVPRSASRPIAVLMDGLTASSGEAVLISLRGRPNTRFIGTASCGLSTGNATFILRNGDRFAITSATMADRTGRVYGDRVMPDEQLAIDADFIIPAVAWLRAQQ